MFEAAGVVAEPPNSNVDPPPPPPPPPPLLLLPPNAKLGVDVAAGPAAEASEVAEAPNEKLEVAFDGVGAPNAGVEADVDEDESPPPKENPVLFPLAGVEFPKVEPPAPLVFSFFSCSFCSRLHSLLCPPSFQCFIWQSLLQ